MKYNTCGDASFHKFVITCSVFYDGKMEGKAVNVIEFSARGLTLLSGQLTIDASFKIVSNSVSIYIPCTFLKQFLHL